VAAAPLAIVGVSPNPSTDVSRIRFRLAASQGGLGETASLAIYDMSGRAVFRAALDGLTPGEHVFEWDGRDSRGGRVASGVYGVEVRAAASRSVARIVRF
jgi:flagellar hook assembly protein FlgD